jgi:hypothetical protein
VMLCCASVKTWNEGLSWSHSEGLSDFTNLFTSSSFQSLTTNALLINSPQLAISIAYVLYDTIITSMFVSYECSKFSITRKVLRVSRPRGSQKSTYWLQLPYRYSLPIMISAATLHWLVSRGVYLTNVKVYNITGEEVPTRVRFGYDTNGMPLLFAFLIMTGLIFLLVFLMRRKLGAGMPIIGTSSLAISAACHPAEGDEDAATRPLMYGAVKIRGVQGKRGWHVCFSSKDVVPLQDGEGYY